MSVMQRAAWHDTYDAQMSLWRWYRTTPGQKWLYEVFKSQASNEDLTPSMKAQLASLFDAEGGKLLDTDPIFCSADMSELVDAAKDDFAPEPLLESDLVTPRAFLWYEKPITIQDKDDNDLQIRAFSWAQQYRATDENDVKLAEMMMADAAWDALGPRITVGEAEGWIEDGLMERVGVAITLYADRDSYIDLLDYRQEKKDLVTTKYMADQQERIEATATMRLIPIHIAPWWYGMSFDGNELDLEGKPTGMSGWWRMAQTTMRLMQQKLAHRGFYRPPRPQRREMQRLGGRPDTEVVVVRLRREGHGFEPHEGGEANYSHRFIVGGHWRNQYYPSERIHRQIYIAPYVKGPEDKPLIVRPRRVFQWTR